MLTYFKMIMEYMIQSKILPIPNMNVNELSKYILNTILNKWLIFLQNLSLK